MATCTRARISVMAAALLSAAVASCAMPEPIPLFPDSGSSQLPPDKLAPGGSHWGASDGGTFKALDVSPPAVVGDSDGKADMQPCPPTDASVDGVCGWTRDGRVDGVGDRTTAQDGPKPSDGTPVPDGPEITDGGSAPGSDGLQKSD